MWKIFHTLEQALPYLLSGIPVTMGIVLGAMFTGLIIGVPLALVQVYGNKKVAWLASGYVWFFRGVPILVLLFLFYFGLFSLLGLNLSPFTSFWIVLGLCSAAYQSQIFRGAIQSLPQGQLKAAKALGMTNFQTISNIILPQAMRVAIPRFIFLLILLPFRIHSATTEIKILLSKYFIIKVLILKPF